METSFQLESLRETVNRMRNEMMALKSDNEKLAEDAVRRSLHSSRSSLNQITDAAGEELTERNQIPAGHYGGADNGSSSGGSKSSSEDGREKAAIVGSSLALGDDEKRLSSTLSEGSVLSGPSSLDMSGSTDPTNRDGGRIVSVTVASGSGGQILPGKNCAFRETAAEVMLGTISVSGKCSWDLLDSLVQRLFKEYVMRVDPASNLGLVSNALINANSWYRGRQVDFSAAFPGLILCVREVM